MERMLTRSQSHPSIASPGFLCPSPTLIAPDDTLEDLQESRQSSLSQMLQEVGSFSEAEPLAREVEQTSRSVLGDKHPDSLVAMSNLAQLLTASGKTDEAQPLDAERVHGMPDYDRRPATAQHLALLLSPLPIFVWQVRAPTARARSRLCRSCSWSARMRRSTSSPSSCRTSSRFGLGFGLGFGV